MFCAFLPFYCQDFLPIQNYTPDSYQGETQNWDICQSDKKIIYIANNKGLLEFNGANWKLYPSPNQSIMRSVFAYNNRIYTGCYMEFGFWEKDETQNLVYTSLSKKIKNNLLPDEHFWNIICYQQGVLFQSLHRIYIYDTHEKNFKIISAKDNLPKMFAVGNQLYFQKINEGVFRLESGKALLISNSPVFKNNIIINIFSFANKLLIETQEKGFFIYDNGNVSPWITEATQKINSLSVYCSQQLKDGNYVLGTIGEGIYILSSDGKIIQHLDKKTGLQNNTVLSVFEDADNNVWLGLDNGISLLNYSSPFRVFYDTNGIFGTIYTSIYHQGKLYIGTNQGLFYRNLNSAENFKLINGTKGQVWMLTVIDNTLFCGHNSGTFIINDDNANIISSGLGTWEIKRIENNPNLLLLGNYEGLCILEKTNGNWHFRNKIEGFNISSRYFEIISDNQIFVNHEHKGIYKLKVSSDYKKVISVEKVSSIKQSLNSGIVKYNNQLLYFGQSGFFKYNMSTNQFKKDDTLNSVILNDDSYISGKMITDDDQTLWIFTKENITVLSSGRISNKPNIQRITLPLSVRENVIGYENILHLGNSIYLLGTTNGYILFDLNKIADKDCNVQISSVEKSKFNQIPTSVPLLSKIYKLKSNENNLHISFNVPVFERFTFIKYQYKLDGMYDEWSNWSVESDIEFKNLSSGKYTFYVRAKIGNKISSNIATFRFKVAKPWYASWWMIMVYVMCFGVLLLYLNRLYKIRYDKKTEKINQEKQLMQLKNEKEIIKLKNDNLNNEMSSINRELASTTMAIVKKNELLNTIRIKLQQGADGTNVRSALKIIDENVDKNSDWEAFQEAFNSTDRDFLRKLKELHPSLTPNDLKLCVYLRLNLSSKEIAPMLNISPQSVEIKRFRLRKKMELNHQDNLTDYILGI